MTWAFIIGEWLIVVLLWRLGTKFGTFTESVNKSTEKLSEAIAIGTVLQEQQEIINAEQRYLTAELKRLKAS